MADLLLSKRRDIGHPDPDFAVPLALLLVAVAVNEIQVLPRDADRVSQLIPDLHAGLADELPRVVLEYLDIEG